MPPFVKADLAEDDLRPPTGRTGVVINVARPFTPTAERVIEAAGETQSDGEGLGATDPIAEVIVRAAFLEMPVGKVPMFGSVSTGTLASVIEMLESDRAALVGDTGVLLPASPVRTRPAPLRLSPFALRGRRLAAFTPVSFLNAPIVNRTGAPRAAERLRDYLPATYREGVDVGLAVDSPSGWKSYMGAVLRTGVQRTPIGELRRRHERLEVPRVRKMHGGRHHFERQRCADRKPPRTNAMAGPRQRS